MNDAVSLNSGEALSSTMRTVDDSKTSTLNLWTSDYITKYFKSQQPILFSGYMRWADCAPSAWRRFSLNTYKPEQQSIYITSDQTAFKCEKNGVYAFTLNVLENAKTHNSFYSIDFLSTTTPVVVGKNYPITNQNPITCQRIMSLTAGQFVQFRYFLNEPCTVMSFASFVIQEMN
jgi:hypothetical protein